MTSYELRKKFLDFFAARGHAAVPSSSLIPDDPSVLLTTAGMQQFKKYYTGEADPMRDFGSRNTASIQKSFRTSDIDEVGDETHLTFFEMMGNFSFDGYFKEEAIVYANEFIAKEVGLPIDFVTVFMGDGEVPPDEESEKIWKKLGVAKVERRGKEDNFWGPTGAEGPCGPTTEIYVNGIEIWNIVFNEYYCNADKTLTSLAQKGVDTGMGLERLAMVMQGKKNIFETDLFKPLMETVPAFLSDPTKRIIVDHARAIAFLIADGILPSNKDAGYILRRLARRYIVRLRDSSDNFFILLDKVIAHYGVFYPELNREKILPVFENELFQFKKTLDRGIREIEKMTTINTASAFRLYESYGLPYEVIKDVGGEKAKNLTREDFDAAFKRHQKISRAGAEAKFGGHGLYLKTGEVTIRDESEVEKVTRLHTATHLLHAGLRAILGPEVRQDGSDITAERTRFDFRFPRKVTSEELEKVEQWVNEAVQHDLSVKYEEMPYEEAVKTGALGFFREKYPPMVKVYSVYDSKTNEIFSRELCGGPHVTHTGEIGHFRIIKEEASSAGVRRIRATID